MSREERRRLKAERERLRYEIGHTGPNAPPNPPAAAPASSEGSRSFCRNCGSMLYVGEASCWKCQAPAPVPPPPPPPPPYDYGTSQSGAYSTQDQDPPLQSIDDLQLAYEQLGVSATASDEEVKRAWVWQISRLHPDLQNTDEVLRNVANQRSMKINAAYDAIRDSRGMR